MAKRKKYGKRSAAATVAKSKTTGATAIKVLAVVLMILLAAYVTISLVFGSWTPVGWNAARQEQINGGGKTPDDTYGGNDADDNGDNLSVAGGSELGEVIDNGITLYSAVLPRAAYAANGVSELAENAYSLTAEIIPDYASNKLLNWSVAWQDGESEWAKGKKVTDYVTITPTKDGASTAVCACLKDFGEPIIVTVSSRSNPEVSGVCFVQYYQRIKSLNYTFKLDGETVSTSADSHGVYKLDYTGAENNYTVELNPVYSAYTLTDNYTTAINGKLSTTFGYTTTSNLNSLTLPAGLSGGEQEMSAKLSQWCSGIKAAYSCKNPTNVEIGGINRAIETYLSSSYGLTSTDKQHPRYIWYMNAINTLTTDKHFISTSYDGKVGAQMDKYVPAAYRYCNAEIASYNDFVSAVKKCNTAGVGVLQYTVKIDGNHSSYETVLNLSYNDEFKVNVQGINLSDIQIAF